MTDIVKISKNNKYFYPQTHAQAVVDLNNFVQRLIDNSRVDLTKYQTSDEVKETIDAILQDYLTSEDVDSEMIEAISKIPATDLSDYLTKEQVSKAIDTAVSNIDVTPDLSNYLTKSETITQIQTIINKAIIANKPDLSNYQNLSQVQTTISTALVSYLTGNEVKSEITSAISKIPATDLSDYLTKEQVSKAIDTAVSNIDVTPDLSNYLTKSETITQIQTIINKAIVANKPDLSKYQTITQVQAAITSAVNALNLSNYYTKAQTNTQIQSLINSNRIFLTQELPINTSVFTGHAYVTKQGRLVTIQYNGMDVNNTYTKFATLPSFALPMYALSSQVFCMDSSYHTYSAGVVNVGATGKVTVQSPIGYGYVQFTVTYLSAN